MRVSALESRVVRRALTWLWVDLGRAAKVLSVAYHVSYFHRTHKINIPERISMFQIQERT